MSKFIIRFRLFDTEIAAAVFDVSVLYAFDVARGAGTILGVIVNVGIEGHNKSYD